MQTAWEAECDLWLIRREKHLPGPWPLRGHLRGCRGIFTKPQVGTNHRFLSRLFSVSAEGLPSLTDPGFGEKRNYLALERQAAHLGTTATLTSRGRGRNDTLARPALLPQQLQPLAQGKPRHEHRRCLRVLEGKDTGLWRRLMDEPQGTGFT